MKTLKKIQSIMIEQLVNPMDYEKDCIKCMSSFIETKSFPFSKEKLLEKFKEHLKKEIDAKCVYLDDENHYILKYDKDKKLIIFTDGNECLFEDAMGFGVQIEGEINSFVYLDIAQTLNEHIKVLFGDNIEDCGEFWVIKE